MASVPLKPPVAPATKPKKDSTWFLELGKFLYRDVVVEYQAGDRILTLQGKMVAYYPHGRIQCILDLGETSVIVASALTITRARKKAQ
jgi:hypothetical protein